MAELRTGLPDFWSTALAKVLVGDQPCRLAPWLKAHYVLPKRQGDGSKLAEWKVNHTALLTSVIGKLRAEGWRLTIEKFFRLKGTTASVSGKPDIIAQGKPGRRPLIVDAKSGEPRESDIAQVKLYMVAIPLVWGTDIQFSGLVVYPTHEELIAHHEALEMRTPLFELVKRLATGERPPAAPSPSACRFCEASVAECPEKCVDEPVAILTSEF